MKIQFWGVRGSIPTPLTPQQIQAKISAVIQRVTPEDIVSDESRDSFIDSLPSWIFGTCGGNTPCVEVTSDAGRTFVFDAGTGIRSMGKLSAPPADSHYDVFFSHFHWDHIQGLPFFDGLYDKGSTFDIYSPFPDMESYLREQMKFPYYPVDFSAVSGRMKFHLMKPGVGLKFGDVEVSCIETSHPGCSYSYSVSENGRKFVYATDVELSARDFSYDESRCRVFQDADVLVMDAQYSVEDSILKEKWGHSAFCYVIDFAVAWNVKKLYLFHHEPTYDDRKLNMILESAEWYSHYISSKPVEVYLAYEGLTIKL